MTKTCPTCGEVFDGKPEKKYCGIKCRKRAERARERANDPKSGLVSEEKETRREFALVANPSITAMTKLIESRALANETEKAILVREPSEALIEAFDLVNDIDDSSIWIYL